MYFLLLNLETLIFNTVNDVWHLNIKFPFSGKKSEGFIMSTALSKLSSTAANGQCA